MCSPKKSSKNNTKAKSRLAKTKIATMKQQGKDTSKFEPTGFAKIKADIAGDLDPSKRDLGYQSRLAGRQEASQKALADMKRRRKKRNDK